MSLGTQFHSAPLNEKPLVCYHPTTVPEEASTLEQKRRGSGDREVANALTETEHIDDGDVSVPKTLVHEGLKTHGLKAASSILQGHELTAGRLQLRTSSKAQE